MRRWFSFASATGGSSERGAEKSASSSAEAGARERLLLETKVGQQRALRLPPLAGPFKQLGFIDVECAPPSVESTSSLPNSTGASEVSVRSQPATVYARIYYPAAEITEAGFEARRAPWIPSAPYYASYGYFVRLPWLVSQAATRYLFSAARIPAVEGLAPHADTPSLPLVIFSHGMGAMRTTYSSYCTQLASQGFIVACVEHRDGSACLTLLDQHSTPLVYLHPTKAMRDAPYDARKFNDEVMAKAIGEHTWRHAQLQKRVQEVRTLADCLLSAHGNDAPLDTWSPSETHLSILDALRQKCKDSSPVIAGHSFGAATAIMAASMDARFRVCWALDPWLFPLPEGHPSEWMQNAAFDLLTINSYSFQWAENLLAMRRLDQHLSSLPAGAGPNRVAQVTLMGSTHQEFGDFPCLVSPSVIRFVRGAAGSVDPEMAIYTAVAACLRFSFPRLVEGIADKGGAAAGSPKGYLARLFSPSSADGRERAVDGAWRRAVEVAEEVFGSHRWCPTFFPIIDDLLRVDYFDVPSRSPSGTVSSNILLEKTSSSCEENGTERA